MCKSLKTPLTYTCKVCIIYRIFKSKVRYVFILTPRIMWKVLIYYRILHTFTYFSRQLPYLFKHFQTFQFSFENIIPTVNPSFFCLLLRQPCFYCWRYFFYHYQRVCRPGNSLSTKKVEVAWSGSCETQVSSPVTILLNKSSPSLS